MYWLFGCSLIAEEARLYALAGTDPEHPWRKHRVVERIAETDDVVTLVLEPLDGAVADHRAGSTWPSPWICRTAHGSRVSTRCRLRPGAEHCG